jgi:hypothetical protein
MDFYCPLKIHQPRPGLNLKKPWVQWRGRYVITRPLRQTLLINIMNAKSFELETLISYTHFYFFNI